MKDTTPDRRFALHRIDDSRWVIRDARLPEFAARPIAHITMFEDDDVEVIWSSPLPLPVVFATPEDAVSSLEQWSRGRTGSTKPIPIPHFPPPRG
jgi:hypothetical protein